MPEQQVADDSAERGLETLRRTIAENSAKHRTEMAEADKKIQEAVAARVASDEAAINNGIAAAEASLSNLEADYAAALEDDNFQEAAKIQRKMTEAATGLDKFKDRKSKLETWKKTETERISNQQQRQDGQPTHDQLLQQYTPKTQAWINKYADIDLSQPNSPLVKKAHAAHYAAVAEDLVPDTQAYFDYMDKAMGGAGGNGSHLSQASQITDGGVEVDLNQSSPSPQDRETQQQPAPQPVSRSSARVEGNGGSKDRVVLSAREQEVARFSRPDLPPEDAYREYAVAKRALQEEGRI